MQGETGQNGMSDDDTPTDRLHVIVEELIEIPDSMSREQVENIVLDQFADVSEKENTDVTVEVIDGHAEIRSQHTIPVPSGTKEQTLADAKELFADEVEDDDYNVTFDYDHRSIRQ